MDFKLETKEVTLKNRKVVVRELTAFDEFTSLDLLGEKIDPEDMGKAFLKQLNAQIAMSIVSVDGVKVDRPKKFDDLLKLMVRFKKNEWAKITVVYNELNGEEKEETDNFLNEQTDLQETQTSANV